MLGLSLLPAMAKSRHPFDRGIAYNRDELVAYCEKYLRSGRLKNPANEEGFLEAIRQCPHDRLVWVSGLSFRRCPWNPRAWRTETGEPIWEEHVIPNVVKRQVVDPQPRRTTTPPDANFPDELGDEAEYPGDARKRVTVNAYERDPAARSACIKKHGLRCAICKMTFEQRYGSIGRSFIHIHHKRRTPRIDPIKDLIPVCPNCHAMLHTQKPPLGIDELQLIFQQRNAA